MNMSMNFLIDNFQMILKPAEKSVAKVFHYR